VVNELLIRQQFFDDLAFDWDSRFLNSKLDAFLENFVPFFGLKQGQRVLDVGTGTGILIPHLLREVGSKGEVIAVDYSWNMIKACKSKNESLFNIGFCISSIEQIACIDNVFDAVICFGVFPHLENRLKGLFEINRIVKKGGHLIISHALSSQELRIHHKKASSIVTEDFLPNSTEMRNILKKTGFSEITILDKPGCYFCLAHKY